MPKSILNKVIVNKLHNSSIITALQNKHQTDYSNQVLNIDDPLT